MENYWSDARLAERRGHRVGRQEDEPHRQRPAAGGIQFLQDLIWTDKVMPDPTIWPADSGDAFEQGKAAMEVNGSWLVATDIAAGLDFGIAPLPKGPAGRATSINPTGAVVYKGTKSPDAAWAFVKYLASPAAQTKLMELKASLPANKEVLAGPFSTSFEGAAGPRRRDRVRPPQAVVQGLRRVDDRAPDGDRRERFHGSEEDGQAGDRRRAATARRDPRKPVTSSRPLGSSR